MKKTFVTIFLTAFVALAANATPWVFANEEIAVEGGPDVTTGTVSEFTRHLDNASEGCGCGTNKPK